MNCPKNKCHYNICNHLREEITTGRVMAKKLASKKVNHPAPSSPHIQQIKDLIALGITKYKSDELEFEVHPAVVVKPSAPSSESNKEAEGLDDIDEKQFQTVFKGKGA